MIVIIFLCYQKDGRSERNAPPPLFPPLHTQLNTRAELRFHVDSADWIPYAMRQRFNDQQRHRINKSGEFVLSSQEHR